MPDATLSALGWDATFADAFAPFADRGCQPGRVARTDRGACTVLTPAGPIRVTTREGPAVGDWVALGEGSTIAGVLPRRSAFVRREAGDRIAEQVVAANIDSVFLVASLADSWRPRRLERYLAVGWQSGATPVIVLTKPDLCPSVDQAVAEAEAVAIGTPVHVVNPKSGEGVDGLRGYASDGSTVALLGLSGVGKSTIVNALAGEERAATGDIRSDGKGRHTTTHRELMLLPGGGVIIDTPGLRGLALWEAAEGLERAFADVEELASACRFSDCGHNGEPGCAIAGAVAEGLLSEDRVASWRKLQREAEWVEHRREAAYAAEQRKLWKQRVRDAGPTRIR